MAMTAENPDSLWVFYFVCLLVFFQPLLHPLHCHAYFLVVLFCLLCFALGFGVMLSGAADPTVRNQ